MKKLLIILVLFTFTLTGCANKNETNLSSLDEIKENGTMVVGYTNYPPLGFQDEKGDEVGLDLELAKEVAAILGVDVEFQYIDWDNKTFELNNKNIDMIWNGFTVTEEREKEVNFGKPYMDNQIVILSLKDNPIKSISELDGLDVGVETQSSGQSALEASDIYESLNEMQKYTNVEDAVLALNAKTVDAVVADVTFAGYILSKDPDKYVLSDDKFDSEYYAIGFRKEDDDSLRDAIDAAIDELIEQGFAKEISEKWLGKDLIQRPWVIGFKSLLKSQAA